MCPPDSNDEHPTGTASGDAAAVGSARQPGVLLVDDDPFMLAMQSRMLRTMGYEKVATAGSGVAGLALLAERPRDFDVIVCDINMPSMDGIEFLQIVNRGTFHGGVILLSGEGVRIIHTVQKLLGRTRLEILGALEKPARRAPLNALLERWKPFDVDPVKPPAQVFTDADLHTAQRELQWLLHYQPKVDLRTGAVAGMEALVRWNHPEDGLLYPERFIGQAEECGAIGALTEWVLQDALKQSAVWRAQGLKLQVAVNVSMENLRTPEFARSVGELARAAGVSPPDLMLEITESRLMAQDTAPLESLVRLRLQRFGLSIDDFGTGHSSLVQLRDVPFTELKVDQGFVQGARYNQIIRPILEGSIGIAKRMGMLSVAEGVETEDDWHLLRSIGCDLAQGYFIGRPMGPEEVPEWMAAWRTRLPRLVGA